VLTNVQHSKDGGMHMTTIDFIAARDTATVNNDWSATFT